MYLCTFLSCKAEPFFTKKYIYLNFCINAKITKNSASMAKQKKNCLCMNFPIFFGFFDFSFLIHTYSNKKYVTGVKIWSFLFGPIKPKN